MSPATKCPNCNAPIVWKDGAKTLECTYCHTLIDRQAVRPRAGSGPSAMPFLVLGLVALFLVGGVVFFLFARTAPTPASDPSAAAPAVLATPVAAPRPAPPPPPPSPLKELFAFGERGTNAGQLKEARRLAVTRDGSIFVAEGTGRLQKFDAKGAYVDVLDVPATALTKERSVFGLAASPAGHLFLVQNGDIVVVDGATLKVVRRIKGDYPNMWFHGAIAVEPTGGFVAITDRTGDKELVSVSAAGKVVGRKKVDSAVGVAVDGVGTRFVSRSDHRLDVYDAKGEVVTRVGGERGTKPGELDRPGAIAFDGKGHLFVENRSGIDVFDTSGRFVVALPVRATDFTLDEKGTLFVLADDSVHAYEVALP